MGPFHAYLPEDGGETVALLCRAALLCYRPVRTLQCECPSRLTTQAPSAPISSGHILTPARWLHTQRNTLGFKCARVGDPGLLGRGVRGAGGIFTRNAAALYLRSLRAGGGTRAHTHIHTHTDTDTPRPRRGCGCTEGVRRRETGRVANTHALILSPRQTEQKGHHSTVTINIRGRKEKRRVRLSP